MKKTLTKLVTLLLVVAMLFGVTSTAVFAAGDQPDVSDNGAGGSVTPGDFSVDWCEISWDDDGITVTLNANAEAVLNTNRSELESVLDKLIEAVMTQVVADLKSALEGENLDVNSILTQKFDEYVQGKYETLPLADAYVEFLRDLLDDDENVIIDDLIDEICSTITELVKAGGINIDSLPETSEVEKKIASIFEAKIEEYIDAIAAYYIDLYVAWLVDPSVEISKSVLDLVSPLVDSYIKERVNAYIDNGFKAPAEGAAVDSMIAEYMDAEIRTQVDTWIQAYANGTLEDGDVKTLIDKEIKTWVTDIADNYAKGTTPQNNPVYGMVSGMLDGIVDDKVLAYIEDYLNERTLDSGIKASIEAALKAQVPDVAAYIYNLYWTHKDDGTLDLSDPFWGDMNTQMRDNIVPIIMTVKYMDEASAETYYDSATHATISADLGDYFVTFETEAKATVESTINSFGASDWHNIWDHLTENEHKEIVELVEASDAFKSKVADVIKAYWNDDTDACALHRREAVQKLVKSDEYASVLNKVIADAEADSKDLIKAKVDEYLIDAIATLRNVISDLSDEDIAKLKTAIDDMVESRGADITALAMETLDFYIDRLLSKYDEVITAIKEGKVEEEYNIKWLLGNVDYIKVGEFVLFSDMSIDVEALKQFVFALPTLEDVAAMSEDEMSLTYAVEIATASFGTSKFNVTAKIGEGYELVNKYATLAAKYIDFDMNDEGVIIFDINVPEKFAELVLRAANSDKVPETLKHKVFAAFAKTPDDAYAFINDLTFDELLKVFDYVDVDELLDSKYVEKLAGYFERLDGLTEAEIKAKVEEYEWAYVKLINLMRKAYSYVPESLKSKSIFSLYDGNGNFSHGGEYSVDIEKLLDKVPSRFSKYTELVSSFMSNTVVEVAFSATAKVESINKVEFIVEGVSHSVGFLPVGADLDYFANVARSDVVGWIDGEGDAWETMPDHDIVLYAVIESVGSEISVEISPDIDKVYDGEASKLSVSIYGTADLVDPSVSYQWYKMVDDAWVPLSGKILSSLDVVNVLDSGDYCCAVEVRDGGTLVASVMSDVRNVNIEKFIVEAEKYSWTQGLFTYDGTEKSVYLVDADGAKLSMPGIEYSLNTAVNADTYNATVTFDSSNFDVKADIPAFEWTIEKAVYDMSGITFNSSIVNYTGGQFTIEIEGELPEGVTVKYRVGDLVGDKLYFTERGEYVFVAEFTSENLNYKEIDSMTATLRIRGYLSSLTYEPEPGLVYVKIISANSKIFESYKINFVDATPRYKYFESEEIFGADKVGYVLAAYDICFVDGGVEVTVEDDFEVRILLPIDLRNSAKEFKLVHVDSYENVEEVNYTIEGDYLVFNTDHFSIYSIVEVGDAPIVPEEDESSWIWILIVAILAVLLIAAVIVIIIILKKRKGTTPEEPVSEPTEPTEPSAPAEEAPAEEAPAEEAPAEEAPAEEAPAEEAPAEEAPAEEAPAEEAAVEVAPAPVVVATGDDEDAGGDRIINGEIVHVRYRTSFMSRLIQAEEPLQDYYSVVKNALLSYKGVKARTSWNFESFNKGRVQCAKLNIKGSAFQVYLALDPKEYNANKYHFVDVSDKPKLDKVPMLLKVKSERGLKYALELIEEMMNTLGMEKIDTPEVDYHMPYETTEALAARDLVKIILPAGVTLDGDENLMKVNVGELIENANSDKSEAEEKAPEQILEPQPEVLHVNATEADVMITDEEAEAKIEFVASVDVDDSEHVSSGKLCEINLDTICENFEDGDVVTIKALKEKKLISGKAGRIKVLARGTMTKQLTVYADKFSLQAVKMITLAGGHADQYK